MVRMRRSSGPGGYANATVASINRRRSTASSSVEISAPRLRNDSISSLRRSSQNTNTTTESRKVSNDDSGIGILVLGKTPRYSNSYGTATEEGSSVNLEDISHETNV